MSYRHPMNREYAVEWIDRDDNAFEIRIKARSATEAEDKAEKMLAKRPDFVRIDCVDLDD